MEALTNFFAQYRTVILLILLIVVVYFLMIRPQRKQQKARDEQIKAMKVGTEVMTAGGFYGIIYAIDDENVVLEMLPDYNKLMIRKASIVKFITAEAAAAEMSGKSGKKGLFGLKKPAANIEAPEEAEAEEVVEEAAEEETAEA